MRNVTVVLDFDAEIIPRSASLVGDVDENSVVPVNFDGGETRGIERNSAGNFIACRNVPKIFDDNAANGFDFTLTVVRNKAPVADAQSFHGADKNVVAARAVELNDGAGIVDVPDVVIQLPESVAAENLRDTEIQPRIAERL